MTDNGMIANLMAGVALADREQAERVNIPQAAIELARPYAAAWAKSNSRHQQAANIMRGSCDTAHLVQAFAKAIADEQERCARKVESFAGPGALVGDDVTRFVSGIAQSIRSTPGDVL